MLPDEKITLRSRLGFIGLGYLGSRIARRLVATGFPVIVYDRDHTKAAELSALGARVAPDPGELASDVDVILSCLSDDSAAEAVYFETGNVVCSARPGTRIETSFEGLAKFGGNLWIRFSLVPPNRYTRTASLGLFAPFAPSPIF
ncbi:MAG: hypothetical protein DMG30_17590 [Acidobacteria bacterium]|nr:MAG: hypothetical protein DMG30_17590 [Acidobacteriota bacterium]